MSPCHGYLPGGTSYVSCQKYLKIKYGFEGLISNFDVGLFKPNNQLIL